MIRPGSAYRLGDNRTATRCGRAAGYGHCLTFSGLAVVYCLGMNVLEPCGFSRSDPFWLFDELLDGFYLVSPTPQGQTLGDVVGRGTLIDERPLHFRQLRPILPPQPNGDRFHPRRALAPKLTPAVGCFFLLSSSVRCW